METSESQAMTTVSCSACGQTYRLTRSQRIHLHGKQLKCRKCQQSFAIDLPEYEVQAPNEPTSAGLPPIPAMPKLGLAAEARGNIAAPIRPKHQVMDLSEPAWINIIDQIISASGESFGARFFNSSAQALFQAGNWLVLVICGLLFMSYVYVGIKTGQITDIGIGVALVAGVVAAQYVAIKAINAGAQMITLSPTRLAPTAFLRCVALVSLLAGWAALGTGISVAVSTRDMDPLWPAIGSAMICCYLISLAMNPELLNLHIVNLESAGMEAVGVSSFLLKASLRLGPIIYGGWLIVGTAQLCQAIYDLYKIDPKGEFTTLAYGLALVQVVGAMTTVSLALLVPVALYLAFLFYHLMVDLIHSILALRVTSQE